MVSRSSGPGRGSRPHTARARAAFITAAPDPEASVCYVYGQNPVREALRGRRRVHAVLAAARARAGETDRLEAELAEWCRGAGRPVPPIRLLDQPEMTARLGTPDHQGLAAEVDPYAYADPGELLTGRTLLVALDGVQDPHNLGALIRTAEAAGAGVVIPRHRAVEVTAAVVKASAGATEHAAVARVRNLSDFLRDAKRADFWTYGAVAGSSDEYAGQNYTYPTCFVLGSEGEGLSRRVASCCDVLVSLPLLGRVGSLNVSVSGGVLLYEALRQRRGKKAPDGAGLSGEGGGGV
ncbi:MAG: 23S rRNA (guanosine(2251)-2'-O)-methyltransferase RlmB [Thermoleophilia bacterium]|nr:23S rRNA (guanosine(2251)-2'-O)-methyltransferase RlmB [Thermoleophilia bacterium]